MTYVEKLQKEEWRIKRSWIIKRDNYKCQRCGKVGYENAYDFKKEIIGEESYELSKVFRFISEDDLMLNVHHICYREGREPWEYEEQELVTLCPECHEKVHNESKIPVYDKKGKIIKIAKICDRCKGAGYIPLYKNVQNGICFKCGGEGVLL